MTKRKLTTTTTDTTGTPVKPLTLLEQVAEERRLHSERVTALLAEANALALQSDEAGASLPTMERLQGTIAGQYQELAQARDLAARVAADATQMKELGLETSGGEDAALAELEERLIPVAANHAKVEAAIMEVRVKVQGLQQRERQLRDESSVQPEGLLAKERAAVVQEVTMARVSFLRALELAVKFNQNLPQDMLTGELQRMATWSGQSVDALLPAHLRGLRAITHGELDHGINELMAYLVSASFLPGGLVDGLTGQSGAE